MGLVYNPQDLRATTFVGLALRPEETDPGMSATAGSHTPELCSTTSALAVNKDGKEMQIKHANTLYVPKLEYARTLESLPFQHPRQLVALLPTFRQYAFTTSLLQDVFGANTPLTPTRQGSPSSPPSISIPDESPKIQVDFTLAYSQPNPKLAVHFPHPLSPTPTSNASDLIAQLLSHDNLKPSSYTPLRLVVDIGENAETYISEQNVVEADAGKEEIDGDVNMENVEKAREGVKRLEKALDVSGDLGLWVEWLRRTAVKGGR